MRINTNINSMRTQEYMRQNQDKMNVSMNRLSSGKRINSAADDAAGLAIATRMKAREGGLSVAARNTQDGMSLIRTAESAMNSVSNILLRMRDLATQSANGANTKGNQASLQKEFAELKNQIAYISDNTQFNDQNLLKDDSTITIQTMDSSSASQQVGVELSSVSLGALSLSDVVIGKELSNAASLTEASDAASARAAISAIDAALAKVAGNRATLGATLNRLDFNVESLNNQATSIEGRTKTQKAFQR
ncbi:flagellin [Bacillus cereus]